MKEEIVCPATTEELARYNERRRRQNEQQMADAESLRAIDPALAYAMFLRAFEDEVRRLNSKPTDTLDLSLFA